jgi:hypothetical protein
MWISVGLVPICIVGAVVMFWLSGYLCARYDPPHFAGTVMSDCFTTGVVFSNVLGILLIAASGIFALLGLGFRVFRKNQEAAESRTLNI